MSPSGDGAGVVGMEEHAGPGDAQRADRRVVSHTLVRKRKLPQLQQGDVILTGGGVVPLGFQTLWTRFG